MPRSAASHLGLYRLPVSHKKEARLIRVNVSGYVYSFYPFYFMIIHVEGNIMNKAKMVHASNTA